jgi:hypothetical protein
MRFHYSSLALLGLLGLAALSPIQAQVIAPPQLIHFQGRLARPDGTPVPNGNYSIRFSLWTAVTGGTEKWNQTFASVAVKNGTFAALLNTSTGTADKFNADLYLEIKIGTDAPLTPRQQLVSVAYAMKANTVPDGSLTADKFAAGALNNLSWLLAGNNITDPASQFLGTTSNQPLVFRTNNAERMRLDASGNVGIGTNNPAAKLHVLASMGSGSADDGGIVFQHTNTTQGIGFGYNTIYATGSAANQNLILLSRGTGGLLLNPAGGNVGIGTNAPTALLHINGAVKLNGANTLEFGANVAGKEGNAGKIGYGSFTAGTLDIVGAGTGANRKIKFWNEGGAAFTGPIQVTGFQLATGAAANRVLTSDASGNATWQVAAGAGWNLTGNAGTNPATNFLGTTDAQPLVFRANNTEQIRLLANGNVGIGTNNPSTKLHVNGEITATVVAITGGSDVAEPYEVASAGDVKPLPGYVVAIDTAHVGQMRVAARAYDKTVAGIISGANGINPGITLRQKGTVADGALPVASIGRVWCWCDADANGAIEAGDMLTTSDTPGHAMKVSDYNKANGSVIGKAMSSLKSGKGLVLVLVSLK